MHPSPCVQASDQMIWFNLVMDEIGEVAAYLKSTIGRNYPPDCSVFSLEFILLTADGDKLPLETWLVRLDKECADKFVNIRTTLYQQMSTLLKSIIVASRFTPAYRHYVRNQGPDTFIFCYKVFDGEPDLSILGEETKYRRLGYLPSPFGAISVELYFRTKMEIQPQPFVPEEEILEEQKSSTKNIGIAIPNEGSRIVPVSPTSLDNINLFSTSPVSQDLQFRASPKFIVGSGGHSFSSVGAIPSAVATTTSGTKSDPTTTMRSRAESPPTSNSFPERNSTPHQKLRVRNNSFPFSSLLLYSRSSSDQLKILPNVPEDDALNTTNLTNNPHGSNISLDNDKTLVSNKEDVRRNSSACTEEFVADNSYVKVIAFASTNGSNSELGTELSEFFKEVRFAPDKLTSLCTSESAVELKDQIPVENSEKGLSSVAMSRGYDYKDEVVITRETMADYDEWLKRFFEEHFHPEGYIKAIRMFKGDPKWVAHNRKDPKTERMEIRKNYLTKLNKYTNQEVLTTIY
uniref:Autophagy-related protein 13 n=1 Tax=Meloidogyne javanica TaxID=6303 RepID=A0A915MBI9_MELJA